MWIIPENLDISHFAPDTAALISDLNGLSEISARSLMWKSKPSPSRTWSRRLKTTCSTWRLFGRILKPSHGQAFETALTSSAAVSLVNHLVLPGKETPTPTRGIYGRTSLKDSLNWDDLPLFSSKTSRGSLAADLKATDGATPNQRRFCYMSFENWSEWTTTRRREYSVRLKSAHPIKESGFSYWLAAPILMTQGAISFPECSETQSGEAWITPRADMSKAPAGGGDRTNKRYLTRLENQVQPIQGLWITPATTAGTNQEKLYSKTGAPWSGSGRAYRSNGMHRTLTLNMQTHIPPREDQNSDHLNRHESRPKLNPRWVELLMGLPVGWVMPSCADPWIIELVNCDCLETELCPQPLNERLECYGED